MRRGRRAARAGHRDRRLRARRGRAGGRRPRTAGASSWGRRARRARGAGRLAWSARPRGSCGHAPSCSARAPGRTAWPSPPAPGRTRASCRSAAPTCVSPGARDLVRSLIYPVPDPRLPFLGVHLTRTSAATCSSGRPRCSPAPRRLRCAAFWHATSPRRSPGRARGGWRAAGGAPADRARSRRAAGRCARAARATCPRCAAETRPAFAGVRAQALARDGGSRRLRVIARRPRCTCATRRRRPRPRRSRWRVSWPIAPGSELPAAGKRAASGNPARCISRPAGSDRPVGRMCHAACSSPVYSSDRLSRPKTRMSAGFSATPEPPLIPPEAPRDEPRTTNRTTAEDETEAGRT